MKENQNYCSICNNLTDRNLCMYCASTERDHSQICVIENNFDLPIFEKTRHYKGLYHILHGSLSPARGVGPNELMLTNLFPRLSPFTNRGIKVEEIVIATKLTSESVATANFIERLLKSYVKSLGIDINKIEIEADEIIEIETIH